MRRVISLWLPRFATDRLCRFHPEWRGKPLLAVREAQGRVEVASVNGAATAAGLMPGMTLADARAILPTVCVAQADPGGDSAALTRLAQWCGRYSPWTSTDTGGAAPGAGIWLDASGCAHLFGGEAALLDTLTDHLGEAGYDARAAIADTPGCAWAVARHGGKVLAPPGAARRAPPGATRDALAPLSVAALRLPAKTVSGLEAVGLRRIADLLPLPRAALTARFGAMVAGRLDAALGDAPEPLSPLPPARPHFARLGFAEPIGRSEDISAALHHLLGVLCAGLEAAGHGARRLTLTLFEPNGAARHIRVGASRPNRDAAHLARLFAEHLETVETAFGIEAITLAATASEPFAVAQPDFAGAATGRDTIGANALIDRLSNRLGAARVLRLRPHESHIPERAVRPLPALEPPGADAAWPDAARPLRLLDRPEEIEATAPMPDDPPVQFRWRRVLYRVRHAEGPERIAPEWWRAGAGPDADRLRDYYRVEEMTGRRFWLYREGLYQPHIRPAWFLHGLFA